MRLPCPLQQALPRLMTGVLAAAFVLPLLVGVFGTLWPALGFMPVLAPGAGFGQLLADPRWLPAAWLSLKTGVLATAGVLVLTLVALVSLHNTRGWSWVTRSLPPLLAVPHAAMAIGLAFLLAPSGWLVRLVSPELTGWMRPPALWVVPDAGGWVLIIGLMVKEAPFLLLAAAAQLPSLRVDEALRIGQSLGYSPARCWSRLILPRLYPRIRLALLVILVFNLTVIDMALLLGPGNPPTFSVWLMSLVNDPGSRAAASAGALVLTLGVLLVVLMLWQIERVVARWARARRGNGHRGLGLAWGRRAGRMLVSLWALLAVASVGVLLLWSVTRRWRFPDALPGQWGLEHWLTRGPMLWEPLLLTAALALATAVLALLAAILWLECERVGWVPRVDALWYVPLLVPQVSLLFGWQAAALLGGVDGHWATVLHAHWVYALPYVILILAVAWREHDDHWQQAAATLGAGYWRRLWHVRLPLLGRPVGQAFAVAVAVSVAQYLPTLLLGAGRVQTLTTELVARYGGMDRRLIASLAVLQALLPLLVFIAALLIPAWVQRPRPGRWSRPIPA